MLPDEHSASSLVPRLPPGNALTRGFAPARWQILSLAATIALAAFLRLWQAGESLWIDELHTSWVVSGTLGDVLPRAAMGNQSPLYFWGMWSLVQATGQSEWTLRLPSLVAGIALPAAVFYLVGQVFNQPYGTRSVPTTIAALAAALLVAIDPTCIFYSQEARPYAWVMLLAVAELVLLKRLIERPTLGRRLALLASSLVLFYLHYTTAIFLGAIIVMLPMLVRVTGSAYPTRNLVLDLLLAAALAAPGVVQMTHIFERRTNWEAFVQEPSWQKLLTEVPFASWALAGAVVVALALLVPRFLPGNALTRGSASAAPPTASRPNALWYLILLASIVVPLIVSWSITALDAARIYYIRYLVALVPLAAAAACLATAWIPWRAVQLAALVALAGWHLYEGGMLDQFARDGRFIADRNEDWRGASIYLNAQLAGDEDAIVVVAPALIELNESITEPIEMYGLFPANGIYRINSRHLKLWLTWGAVHSEVEVAREWSQRGDRRIWYVVRNNELTADERVESMSQMSSLLLDAIPISPHIWDERSFGTINVFSLAGMKSDASLDENGRCQVFVRDDKP